MRQGEAGDYFYIIKEGEAIVYVDDQEGSRKVNHLFKADFFGEKALLSDEPRCCTLNVTLPDTLQLPFRVARRSCSSVAVCHRVNTDVHQIFV